MSETQVAAPFYKSLQPLSARDHGELRLKQGDFGFAAQSPSLPLLVSEFGEASRHYPIVFSSHDATPLAVLGLELNNVFLDDGRWAAGTYVPAYARRYPFGFMQIDDTPRYILGIDEDAESITKEQEGEALFEDGRPSALTERALGFCEAFHSETEATFAFMRALEDRDLLIERQANIVLADGRNHRVDGFKVVDQARFSALDAPTLAEWHTRKWLGLVTLHLASLNRFQDILTRRAPPSETMSMADAGTSGTPTAEEQ